MTYYDTSDLGTTAALMTLGHKVQGIREDKMGKIIFTFEYSQHLTEIVADYFGKGLMLDAKVFYYNLRDLKKQLHELKKNTT